MCKVATLAKQYDEHLAVLIESDRLKLAKTAACDKCYRDAQAAIPHLKSHGIEPGSVAFNLFTKIWNSAKKQQQSLYFTWTNEERHIIHSCDGFDPLSRCERKASKLMLLPISSPVTMRSKTLALAHKITDNRLEGQSRQWKFATLAIVQYGNVL